VASVHASTVALESNDAGDARFTSIENQLASFAAQRDALVAKIISLLEEAQFDNKRIPEEEAERLIEQAHDLLSSVQSYSGSL
jgi:hypothetical protein